MAGSGCRPLTGQTRRSIPTLSQPHHPSRRFSAAHAAGRCRFSAVFTSPTCENACGKFPTSRRPCGSYSSASKPTSFRSANNRSKIAAASSRLPIRARLSASQKVQGKKADFGTRRGIGTAGRDAYCVRVSKPRVSWADDAATGQQGDAVRHRVPSVCRRVPRDCAGGGSAATFPVSPRPRVSAVPRTADSGVEAGQSFANGILDEPGETADLQFVHEVLAVRLDGAVFC